MTFPKIVCVLCNTKLKSPYYTKKHLFNRKHTKGLENFGLDVSDLSTFVNYDGTPLKSLTKQYLQTLLLRIIEEHYQEQLTPEEIEKRMVEKQVGRAILTYIKEENEEEFANLHK